MAIDAISQLMTLRNYRPLVVFATLALSGCPFNFRYNVENGTDQAVAQQPDDDNVAIASTGKCSFVADRSVACEPRSRRPPGG
jgi:hypothetical protein